MRIAAMPKQAAHIAAGALVGLSLLGASADCASSTKGADPYRRSSGSWGQSFPDQWGLDTTHVNSRAAPPGATKPVVVAVIDTGIDYFHPDFASTAIWRNDAERPNGVDDDHNGYVDDLIGWNFLDDDNNPWDRSGHGTHVAGVIGATRDNGEGISGAASHVRLMPVKVMNFAGFASSTKVAAAIIYAVENGARVINLSLGSRGRSKSEALALEFAERRGCVVVAAAGNEGAALDDFGPASMGSVLTVGASAVDGTVAPFSNYGAAVHLVAPGVEILSLRARRTDLDLTSGVEDYVPGSRFVGADARYYRASGTSFAAPFVSAAAAELIARRPELSAQQVRRLLQQSARDVATPGIDLRSGYGLLDVAAALNLPTDYFIEARLAGVRVVTSGGRPGLEVTGIADADQLHAVWMEVGEGRDPDPGRWRRLDDAVSRAPAIGPLTILPASTFAGSKQWTLRLVVEHAHGQRREARFELNLN